MTGRHWQELAAALADSESDVVYEKYLGLTGCRVFMPAKVVHHDHFGRYRFYWTGP